MNEKIPKTSKPKGGLANLRPADVNVVPPKPAPAPKWNTCPPESFCGKIRLLTEEHPEHPFPEEVEYPTAGIPTVPCLQHWNILRSTTHLKFSDPAILARWLRGLANDVEDFSLNVKSVLDSLEFFKPRPSLEVEHPQWERIALLALETAANASFCWFHKIGDRFLFESEGLARRMAWEPERPPKWDGIRVQRRPKWFVQMREDFCFLAPDWFWLTFDDIGETEWFSRWSRDQRNRFKPIVSRIVAHYFSNLFADLSERDNALEGEPEIVRRALEGISPKFSPGEAVGEFTKRQVKIVMESYDKLPSVPLAGSPFWLPGIVSTKYGG